MSRYKATATITFYVEADSLQKAEGLAAMLAAEMEPERSIRYLGSDYQSVDVELSPVPSVQEGSNR